MDDLMRSPIPDWNLMKELLEALRPRGEFWLCRGAVRCELLGELRDWDDFDIMADASEEELFAAVSSAGLSVRRTFYRGYSFRLGSGRKVDIWSFRSTAGQRCGSLAEAISCFEFNVDAIVKSVHSGALLDPFDVYPEIMERHLRLLRTSGIGQNNPYLPWKAAYLVLRHAFRPHSDIIRLWQNEPHLEGIPSHAIPALQDELRRIVIDEEVRAKATRYSGLNAYVSILAPWLSGGIS
jgi:hypothetical protein